MDVNNNSDAVNNQNNSENSNSYNAENSSQSAQSYVNQQSDVYNQPQYDQAQYQQNRYQQDQYQQNQYQQSQYQQNQYQQDQYQQSQYQQDQYQPTQPQQYAQPQYAQPQQTYAQQQYSQAQYGQQQYAQQQYAQSQYAQPQYAQPQQQYGSQYGSPQYGGPQGYAQMQNGNPQGYAQSQYGGQQYGMPGMPQYGVPRGYAQSSLYNRFHEREQLVNSFCSQWNEKERGLVIILSIAVAISTYLILEHPIQTFGYGYSLSTAWLYFAYNLIPLAVVLGFAQVARKNNFVIIASIVWFIVQAIYHIWNHNYFDIKYFIFYMISTLVFIILLEVFQRQFVVRKRSNIGGSILGVLISTFAYVIIMLIFDLINGSSISYFYLEQFAYTFIALSILPIILAAILRAFGLAKFLNPKREEMNM